jgi:hypothetical protein
VAQGRGLCYWMSVMQWLGRVFHRSCFWGCQLRVWEDPGKTKILHTISRPHESSQPAVRFWLADIIIKYEQHTFIFGQLRKSGYVLGPDRMWGDHRATYLAGQNNTDTVGRLISSYLSKVVEIRFFISESRTFSSITSENIKGYIWYVLSVL